MYLEWQKNPTKVIQYLEQLRKQEIMWASNTQEAYNRVATGECMVGVFRSNGFTKMKQDGAPIELAPISYAVSSPTGAILVEGVPHPNAARFLVSWLHSPEGRGALEEIGFSLAEPCDASAFARVLCNTGIKFAQLSKTMEEAKKYLVFQDDAAKALGIPPGSE
jgi:ABC-type Fe3+ transport system substrate-binding protein